MKKIDIYQAICKKCPYYEECYLTVDCEALKVIKKLWRSLNENLFDDDTDDGDQ